MGQIPMKVGVAHETQIALIPLHCFWNTTLLGFWVCSKYAGVGDERQEHRSEGGRGRSLGIIRVHLHQDEGDFTITKARMAFGFSDLGFQNHQSLKLQSPLARISPPCQLFVSLE